MEWKPIENHPKDQNPVLIFYKNSFGKGRTIKAFYAAKFSVESNGDFEEPEYDEKTDQYYYPEGWWEMIDNWGDYSFVFVHEGTPTHWMPLPEPPKESV